MQRLLARLLAWTVLLAFAAACDSADRSTSPSKPPSAQPAMQRLDATHPIAIEPIDAANAGDAKFVEVKITQVTNPARSAISFAVAYQTSTQTIALGSFSLYPPDRPGTFIVPTQGRIEPSGAIRVTMENPDNDARIGVTVAEIRLVTQASSSTLDRSSR